MTSKSDITRKPQPIPGRCKGMLVINQEDDSHIADFTDDIPAGSAPPSESRPDPGSAKGRVHMTDDFNDSFEDYSDDIP